MSLQEIDQIREWPTVRNNMHESLFRSHSILRLVTELLEAGVPGHVVLDAIKLCESPGTNVRIEDVSNNEMRLPDDGKI